jgi:hypothetical protein
VVQPETPEGATQQPKSSDGLTHEVDAESAGRKVPGRIDLLEAWDEDAAAGGLPIGLVRLDQNEIALIPFTSAADTVKLHYCEDREVQGYVHCNGPDCLLCRIGRKHEVRTLLPVYLPTSRSVAVLAISPSCRPGALRPQLMPILRTGKRVALMISRPDKTTFKVGPVELQEGVDDGAEIIAHFLDRWEAGQVDLTAVFPRLDNHAVAELASVATMMKFKGVKL